MRIPFAAFIFLAVLPAVLRAQDCANASSQTAMSLCAGQAYGKTDAELNAAYKQITARLKDDRDTSKLLRDAQRNWLAFRDAECAFSTSASAQGSVYPTLVAQCRDGLTHTRVTDLKAYLHCQEGDLSCPVPSR